MIQTNPMNPEWKKSLSALGMTKDVPHSKKEYEPLKRKLLSLGGEAAVIRHEPDVEKILKRGTLFHGEGVRIHQGNNCRCHENAAKNFAQFGYGIATGYALSIDGAWRQHSWNIDIGEGSPIETTEPRVAYFGFILNEAECRQFAEENPETEMVRSVLDDDYETRTSIVLSRPGQLEIEVEDDNEIKISSRIDMDRDVLGQSVWLVKSELNKDEFILYGSFTVEEIEYDVDGSEFAMILSSTEYSPLPTPVSIEDGDAVKFLKEANTRVDEVLFEIDDDGLEVTQLRSLARAAYEAFETAA